jgi:F0F1-type ATP synthase membrane subunit b/b'
MQFTNYILLFLLGLSLGGLIAWLVAKSRINEVIQDRDTRISDLLTKIEQAEANILKISEERSAANAKLEQMQQLEQSNPEQGELFPAEGEARENCA